MLFAKKKCCLFQGALFSILDCFELPIQAEYQDHSSCFSLSSQALHFAYFDCVILNFTLGTSHHASNINSRSIGKAVIQLKLSNMKLKMAENFQDSMCALRIRLQPIYSPWNSLWLAKRVKGKLMDCLYAELAFLTLKKQLFKGALRTFDAL